MSEIGTKRKGRKALIITLASVLGVLALIFCVFLIYTADYYRADTDAVDAFLPESGISARVLDDETVIVAPDEAEVGLIFYPGGKVEHTAYIPLMKALASRGIACVIVKMPFNLAVFDTNAADDAYGALPNVKRWYIGGHSLGGSMAAAYAAKNSDKVEGLVLLASYSTKELFDVDIKVLSVFGSDDRVLNKEKYQEYRTNLPADFTEKIIDGGNHAYFGMYGEQDGDGKGSISRTEQTTITADLIAKFIV